MIRKYSPWFAFRTLLAKEIWRFMKVYSQTLLHPILNAILFLFVFQVAVGNRPLVDGFDGSFANFAMPGLIMMGVIQNAFANSSSSVLFYKIQGLIIDVLYSPIKDYEIVAAYILASIVRGIVVGVVSYICLGLVGDFIIYNVWLAIYYLIMGSMMMGAFGLIVGIYAQKFDHLATITTLFIMPMSFLSGTFYSTSRMPDSLQSLIHLNPFFHIIDGMRYSLTGYTDDNLIFGMVFLAINALIFSFIAYLLFKYSNRMKS